MIRFRLKELLADKGYRERRVVTLAEVADATGIHRITLSKIANHVGYNTGTDNLDKLCAYFGCRLEDLAQHVPSQMVDFTRE
ncbi:MAG: helix-turn-helix transcriptional regulator [Xanthomonadales bacterium]|nr:helix-turn-helix transcriptional regulator [Xanthomonadales bacterium]